MSTGGGKITDARLAELAEKRKLYAKLDAEYKSLNEYIKFLKNNTSLKARGGVHSSGSSAQRVRGIINERSMEEDEQTAIDRAKIVAEKLEEVRNEITALEDLIKE